MNKSSTLHRPLLTYVLLIFTQLQLHSQPQQFILSNTPFFRLIRDSRFDGAVFSTNTQFPFPLLGTTDNFLGKYFPNMHVLKGEILLSFQATGYVYQSSLSKERDELTFTRVDSTEMVGYNINHYPFVNLDALYNLGGYGFWRWNGQLRKFNAAASEWEIIPLNREIGISNDVPGSCLWKDEIENRLVTLYYIEGNQAIKQPDRVKGSFIIRDTVMSLQLGSGTWTAMGELNPWLKHAVSGDHMRGNLDNGILIEYQGEIYLLDIRNNQVKRMVNGVKRQKLYSKLARSMYWYTKGNFYIAYPNNQVIDSLQIVEKDFQPTGETVYKVNSGFSSSLYWVLAPILLISFYFFRRRSRVKGNPIESSFDQRFENDELRSPYAAMQVFDEVEKGLLELLLNNAEDKGSRTGSDEINRILGVAQKSLDMQKRKRSMVIRSINNKFRLLHPYVDNDLIDRVKSEVDARLFEYFILEKDMDNLRKLLYPNG